MGDKPRHIGRMGLNNRGKVKFKEYIAKITLIISTLLLINDLLTAWIRILWAILGQAPSQALSTGWCGRVDCRAPWEKAKQLHCRSRARGGAEFGAP